MTWVDRIRRLFWSMRGKPYRVKYMDGNWSRQRPEDEADSLASIFGGKVYTEYEYLHETQEGGRSK